MAIYVLARRSCFYPEIRVSGNPDIRVSGYPVFLRVPELKYGKYHMIRTLPGGISAAEALTSTHSCIANETIAMLHILHILAFPEPRCVNLGFSEIPGIRISGNAEMRISGYPFIRLSGLPDVRKYG